MFIGEAIIESRLLSYRGEDTCCEIEGIIIQFNRITVQKCQNLANSWLVKSLQCQCYQRNSSPCLEPSLFDSRKSCIALIIGKQLRYIKANNINFRIKVMGKQVLFQKEEMFLSRLKQKKREQSNICGLIKLRVPFIYQ